MFVAFAAVECVAPDDTIKPGMDASDLISLARDYIGAFRLNHAVLSRRFYLETARNLAKRRARS